MFILYANQTYISGGDGNMVLNRGGVFEVFQALPFLGADRPPKYQPYILVPRDVPMITFFYCHFFLLKFFLKKNI